MRFVPCRKIYSNPGRKQRRRRYRRTNTRNAVPMVKNMEKLAADFSADPEQTLPEAAVMESAKSYREKKAKPLVKKIVQVMRFVYSAYLHISNKFTRLQVAYNRERKRAVNKQVGSSLGGKSETKNSGGRFWACKGGDWI